ncbi:meiosis-specific kinetochore protein-like isoform X2 [Tamandua tetradactyla]|uniref:meiosis-specific kinetochore protein-like isoform X2 n=1 Tax=Tamandua tetradactyla TaxID=48850 RepID=UPI004054061D
MWPLRVYTRKKRAGQRLNLTPTPDLAAPAKAEAPPGPGGRLAAHRPKEKRGVRGLPQICERSGQSEPSGPGGGGGGGGSGPPSTQGRGTGETSVRGESPSEDAEEEAMAPRGESVTDGLQVDGSSSSSELVSGLSMEHSISSSLLSYSLVDSYTECTSSEESLSNFPSPELFRGSGYLDWECPKLEEHMQCRNSTLLDISRAVAVEKAPQFSNISAIVGTSSEEYQKCNRKTVMTLTDQNISPESKGTSNSESDTAACEISLAKKTFPPSPGKTKKKINSTIPDKKSRGLLTSTPSSQTGGFVIDLSSVQKASFEELFPNVSNYVNSNEIVPMSSSQENTSNEDPSNTSEICCIIRASPGTRQVKIKDVTVKKKYTPSKNIPQDIIIKTNDRI